MRVTPLVGEKVWFGPRGWGGWGWQPVSWEGWAVLVAAGLASAAIVLRLGEQRAGLPIVGVVVVLLGICWLKGTSPGSVRAKAAFDRQRHQPK